MQCLLSNRFFDIFASLAKLLVERESRIGKQVERLQRGVAILETTRGLVTGMKEKLTLAESEVQQQIEVVTEQTEHLAPHLWLLVLLMPLK